MPRNSESSGTGSGRESCMHRIHDTPVPFHVPTRRRRGSRDGIAEGEGLVLGVREKDLEEDLLWLEVRPAREPCRHPNELEPRRCSHSLLLCPSADRSDIAAASRNTRLDRIMMGNVEFKYKDEWSNCQLYLAHFRGCCLHFRMPGYFNDGLGEVRLQHPRPQQQ